MKTLFNITTSEDDVDRFGSAADFEDMLKPHFDGVELMFYREDEREIFKKEHVIGYHMQFYHPNFVFLFLKFFEVQKLFFKKVFA